MSARKSRNASFDLPAVGAAADLVPAFSSLLAAMSGGEEAVTIADVLEMKRKAIETVDIERRLAVIEAAQARQK